jgi:hypothetical protein
VFWFCATDGFGAKGQAPTEDCAAIPAEATLLIELELISWKVVEEITPDKKVIKKVLKAGEGYEKPNDGSTVKCEPTCLMRPFLIVDAWVAFGRSL